MVCPKIKKNGLIRSSIWVIILILGVMILSLSMTNLYEGGTVQKVIEYWAVLNNEENEEMTQSLPRPKSMVLEYASMIDFLPYVKNPCWYEEKIDIRYLTVVKKLRCLPYYFTVGFPKCATSDLHHKITQHPDVIEAKTKEINWWTRKIPKDRDKAEADIEKYLLNFDNIASILKPSCQIEPKLTDGSPCTRFISGDGSVDTMKKNTEFMRHLQRILLKDDGEVLWDRFARGRINSTIPSYNETRPLIAKDFAAIPFINADAIHSLLPNARIIVLLRNPIDRIYSGYLYMEPKVKKSPQAFDQKINRGLSQLHDCFKRHSERSCAYQIPSQAVHRLQIGMYAMYIKDWLMVFPKDQFLFIKTEEFKTNMKEVVEKVYNHLGLKPLNESLMEQILSSPLKNENKKEHEPMLNSTREKLYKFYSKYNIMLAQILEDENFKWEAP